MSQNTNLAESFVKKRAKLLNSPGGEKYTWDDFFDEYDVPVDCRSDFAVAAILHQAEEISKAESTGKENYVN